MTLMLQPARPLTEADLHDLFADSFNGWTAQVDCVQNAAKLRGSMAHRVTGIVLLNGNPVGQFARRVSADGRSVNHSVLELIEGARNLGFAGEWIRRCRERYRAAGIELIHVDAVDDGRVVWARMGFEIDDIEWHDTLDRALALDGIDAAAVKALRSSEPCVLALADIRVAGGAASALEQLDWTGSMAA
jgi:hypothetical protein